MKKLVPALIAILLILLIAGGAAGFYLYQKYSYSKEQADLDAYFELGAEEETALLLNHDFLPEKGLLRDGHCYLTLEDVHTYLNDRFYVDRQEGLLLYTLPDQVVSLGLGEIGPDGYTVAFESGKEVYLALDYVKAYSDFNFTVYENPNRAILETEWEETQIATVRKDTDIRYQGGVKSPILRPTKEGERLTILETMENWSRVQTEDGYIGYVENKRLSEAKTQTPVKDTGYEEPDYSGNTRNYKISLAWHQISAESGNSTFPGVVEGVTGINVISPTWFSLYDNEGTVDSFASPAYVAAAHARGLEVWALVDDFTHQADNGVDPGEVLAYTSKRRAVIDILMSEAQRCGFDGINVDFEKISAEGGQDFIQFIRELSVACRQRGLVLSVDNYVPINSNAHYEWREQGVMADYVIIMGYDEHWGGSQDPGSVASLGFVEKGIQKMTELVDPQKVINGIPFYTRIWTTNPAGEVTSQAVGIQAAADYLVNHGVSYEWDEATGQNYAEFETGEGKVQVWLEDEQSIAGKLGVMKQFHLGGVAVWKLGFDEGRKSIWSVIAGFLAD